MTDDISGTDGTDGTDGTAQRLVLDSLIFQSEAEQRWLDHCEAVLQEER